MNSKFLKRILITNDDGIDAPGLKILIDVAHSLAEEIWVVAPAFDQSGVATSISLHNPLRVNMLGDRQYSVTGTPTDCVAIGVSHLMKDTPPDMVLSGINRGANLGAETSYSGTVGGALASLVLGIPAIALSQAFTDNRDVKWETARILAGDVIQTLYQQDWPSSVVLNVNFPDVPASEAKPLIVTRQGSGSMDSIDVEKRTDMREKPYYWIKIIRSFKEQDTLSETHCLNAGHITVSPIGFDRTDHQVRETLAKALDG